jgi:hypothetical protein
VGGHAFSAEIALGASGNTRNNHFVANLKLGDSSANLFDDADAFMPENAPVNDDRHVSFQDVEVGAADRCCGDPHKGVSRFLDHGVGLVLP